MNVNDGDVKPNEGLTRSKPTSGEILEPVSHWVPGEANQIDGHSILRYTDLDGHVQKLDYAHLASVDTAPLPLPVDREGYCSVEQSAQYWATGHGDWLNVKEAMNRFLDRTPSDHLPKIFDFGCATGRFLRHVHWFWEMETHGSDLAPANVDWVKKHLPEEIRVVSNTTTPKLPYDDGFFDVVTAFSVFSHIDEGAEEWLVELKRITRPGGLLYITIQNQAAWSIVNDRPGSLQHLERANSVEGNVLVNRELFDGPMPTEKVVFKMSTDNTYNRNVWLTNEYVQKHWSKWFDIKLIANNAHTRFQAPVIMQPRG